MTHEERANWIRRSIILFIAIGVLLGVWLYPGKQPEPKPAAVVEEQAAAEPKHLVEILHFHLPGNAESETLAESLNRIQSKYGSLVLVTRVDVQKEPDRAKAEKVTRPPKVVMMAGETRACKFQGVWTQAQIERKVDEILHGLQRVGRDWRPQVSGMQPASAAAAAAPAEEPAVRAAPAILDGPPPGVSGPVTAP